MPRSGKRDYFEVLGIGRDADGKEIKRAFRRLARKYHPDVNPGDKEAERKFKEISEAYEVLRDPEKREQYKRLGHMGDMWSRAGAGAPGGFTWQTTVGPDFNFGYGNLDDLLEEILGGRTRPVTRARPPRGQDAQVEIGLTLEEAFRGVERQIAVPLQRMCPTCRGAGMTERGQTCPACGGRGQLEQVRRLQVKIPRGVRAGSRIRLAGQGIPGPGGEPADLYLIATVAPHGFFTRRDDDLHCEVPVSYTEAALGAEIEIPTLNGRVKTKLPPRTSSGRQLRLAGKGMPRMKGGGSGDLYVRIRIVVPKDLTEEEEQLIARLGELRPHSPRANPRT